MYIQKIRNSIHIVKNNLNEIENNHRYSGRVAVPVPLASDSRPFCCCLFVFVFIEICTYVS